MPQTREIESLKSSLTRQDIRENMYDSSGNLVGCVNNEGEQNRHNPDMDTSAEGMRLKKAREMEALRATANPQGLKQRMYDEDGNLVAWNKLNDIETEEDDAGPPSMDLTPDGMRKKKAQEIKSLRTSLQDNNPGASMYDEDGHIVGALNNNEVQERHNESMDVSAQGMTLKKVRDQIMKLPRAMCFVANQPKTHTQCV